MLTAAKLHHNLKLNDRLLTNTTIHKFSQRIVNISDRQTDTSRNGYHHMNMYIELWIKNLVT